MLHATRNIVEFYSAHVSIIKAIIAIQESSEESESFFSFAERAVQLAPSRQMRTISDITLVNTFSTEKFL